MAAIACVLLVVVAGCGGNPGGATATPEVTTSESAANTTTETPTDTTTTTRAETSSRRESTINDYSANLEHELSVSNYLDDEQEMHVKIVSANGTVAFDRTIVVQSNSSKSFNFTFLDSSSYTVIANASVGNATRSWDIESIDPRKQASVGISSDGELAIDFKVV